ncbi:MAG: N-acyl homoserine lactonase family protein [Devosia sp.]|nr:N-acyl homoserine lactonase family protein [Devosia sp.]
MLATYTIRQIQTGWQFLDKAEYGTFREGYGTIIKHPVFCWLIEGHGRRILVDTGMSDTEHSVRHHHDGLQEPGQAIHEQLARLGVSCETIDIILFTHLHWDHCHNLEKFPRARLFVSEREYRFAMDPIGMYWNSYESPQSGLNPAFRSRNFNLVNGEEEILEGIRMIPTPGHSPGHMAVSVYTTVGEYFLVRDMALLGESFSPDKKRGWPITMPGRFYNCVELWNSIVDVLHRADHILMTHDPEQIGHMSPTLGEDMYP